MNLIPRLKLIKKSAKEISFIFLFSILLLLGKVHGQVGAGALGHLYNPLLKSEKNNIRPETGVGYGFFVRHDIFTESRFSGHLRYLAVLSRHNVTFPSGDSHYSTSRFGLELIFNFPLVNGNSIYTGAGINLMSFTAQNRFLSDYNDTIILPSFVAGWSYKWADGFDLFSEILVLAGSTSAGPEKIPFTGVGLQLGITMYVSE